MKTHRHSYRGWMGFLLGAAALLTGAVTAVAADYPTKPIEFIIPWNAGGSADIEGRIIAKAAEKILGQPLVPINKAGAGGALGYTHVKGAAPDGYTVIWNSLSLLTTTNLGNVDFRWDALDAVCRVSSQGMPLAVRQDAPWKTLQDFVAHAKANPGKVKIGNAGNGSGTHLAAVAMAEMTGIKVIHVPLGSGKRIASLLRGEVDAISVPTPEVAGQVKAGELRILAIPSDAPDPAFPAAPTMKQAGVPMSLELFRGISVPKGTPPAIIAKLADAFQKAAHDPTFEGAGEKEGFVITAQGPEDFRKYLAGQDTFVADMVKRAGLGKGN